jgi:hypothetical protein
MRSGSERILLSFAFLLMRSIHLRRELCMKAASIPSALRIVSLLGLAIAVSTSIRCTAQTTKPQPAQRALHERLAAQYGKLPLSFEGNRGQSDSRIKFIAHGGGYGLYLTAQEALLALHAPPTGAGGQRKTDVVRMQLRGANPTAQPEGVDTLPGTVNYFIGSDRSKWQTGIPLYSRVKFAGVYPGVDVVYYGDQSQLEYDFVVAPLAEPKAIRLHFAGASKLALTADGDLEVFAGNGQIAFHKPVVYQENNGRRQAVKGNFTLLANHSVGFSLGSYNHSQRLIIDPVLIYSTYLGGSSGDDVNAIAVDSAGNAYVAGLTGSSNFPVTPGAFEKELSRDSFASAFVTKLDPTGTTLVYSTYLISTGVWYASAHANAIAVDDSGDAYVTGATVGDFPVTSGAFQTSNHNEFTAFVTKLNPTGSALVYSTYLGGSGGDSANALALNASGNAYIAGTTGSTDFPVTPGSFQTTNKATSSTAFISELNATGSDLIYSTYLGGSSKDSAQGIALDGSGHAYVAGGTGSDDFPVTTGAYLTTNGGGFITELNATGASLIYSTDFDAAVAGIAIDGTGNAYLTGAAGDSFPVTPGAIQSSDPEATGFITKLNSTGTALDYSATIACGTGASIRVDKAGNAFVAGFTGVGSSADGGNVCEDLPVTPGAFEPSPPDIGEPVSGAFVSKLNSSGTTLLYSTYLSGSTGGGDGFTGDGAAALAVDSSENAYVAGTATSFDFPVTAGAFQTINKNGDLGAALLYEEPITPTGFVSKLALADPPPTTSTTTALVAETIAPIGAGMPYPSGQFFNEYYSTFSLPGTYTATVTANGTSTVPAGDVVFEMNGVKVATVPLTPTGTASYTTSEPKFGTSIVQAFYTGNSSFSSSDAGVAVVVIPASPSFSPGGGKYIGSVVVTMSTASPDTTIYYMLDGSTPGAGWTVYTGPITLTAGTTMLWGMSAPTGQGASDATQVYSNYSVIPQTPTPVMSPVSGSYAAGQLITITDAIPTATIRYTTDGSTPTTHSNWYHGPIVLTGPETIQSIAISGGAAPSEVASATYTVP